MVAASAPAASRSLTAETAYNFICTSYYSTSILLSLCFLILLQVGEKGGGIRTSLCCESEILKIDFRIISSNHLRKLCKT